MKLSVIVPSYKFEHHIEQCLLSILSQKTNFDFEILVRDDFSQDNSDKTIERIATHYPQIKYFKATENWGGHKNVKFLLDRSIGEYISYIDGDDYWFDLYKLQKQVDFLDSNLDYSLTCAGYWVLKPDGYSYPYPGWMGYINKDEIDSKLLSIYNVITSPTRTFRNVKDLWKDYYFDMPYLDWPLNFELSLLGKIKYLDFPCGVYRDNGKGALTSLDENKKFENYHIIKNKLTERYNENIGRN
jgi:glycosyltransferase involved in cell wall biosynthesis